MSKERLLHILVALVFIAAGITYLFLNYKHSYFYGMTADSAIYILLADGFSPFVSGAPGLRQFLLEKYPFPPLFPLVMALFGAGSGAPLTGYLLSSLAVFASLVIYYHWNKSIFNSRASAILLVAIFAFMPNTFAQLTIIQSEHLYLLLTLSGFMAHQRAQTDRQRYLASVFFGLAAITRTVGIIALVVYVLVLWRKQGILAVAKQAVLAFLPLMLWFGYKSQSGGSGYLEILAEGMGGDVIQNTLSQAGVNIQLMWLYWIRCFDNHILLSSAYSIALITLVIAVGFMQRLLRGELDALYISGYLLVLLIWPYPAQYERFFYVIMPFVLSYGVYALLQCRVYFRKSSSGVLVYAYVAMLALVMLPSILSIYARLDVDAGAGVAKDAVRSIEWMQSDNLKKTSQKHAFMNRIFLFMEGLRNEVPGDSCIISTVPEYLMLHSGRKSIKPPSAAINEEKFMQGMKACEYVLMVSVIPKPNVGNPAMYPYHRIKHKMRVRDVMYEKPGDTDSYVIAILARHSL